ncbi:MAG: segregation/condensation protein A, partial [Pseudonocardiaceae bacterium]
RVRLAEAGSASFGDLVSDCEHTMEVVARFLALLELYRESIVRFQQPDPLGDLLVRWSGGSVEQATEAGEQDLAGTDDEEYG